MMCDVNDEYGNVSGVEVTLGQNSQRTASAQFRASSVVDLSGA